MYTFPDLAALYCIRSKKSILFSIDHAGQGTGLGLSLGYDIVKVYGGELKVESKKGEGSVFTVLLTYA